MNLREYHHEPSSQPPAGPVVQTDYRARAEQLLGVGGPTIDSALSTDSLRYLAANQQQSAQ